MCINTRNIRHHAALRILLLQYLLIILWLVATNEHRWYLSLNILRPCYIPSCQLILRKVMINLSFDYLKLINSVLRIIPRMGSINWILYTFNHGIEVSRNILMCSWTLSIGNDPIWLMILKIVFIMNFQKVSLYCLKLMGVRIFISLWTVAILRSIYYSLKFFWLDMIGSMRKLILILLLSLNR